MKQEPTALELSSVSTSWYDENGFLGLQCASYGDTTDGLPAFQALHPFGFYGRPTDSSSTSGCNSLSWSDGDESHALALNDPRIVSSLPSLPKGGSVQYDYEGRFALFDPETETYTVYVPYNDGANAHVLTIGKDGNGKEYVGIVQGNGLALTMLENTLVIKNAAGDAYIQVDDDGIVLNGNVKLVGGLDVGGGTALPLVTAPALLAWMAQVATAVGTIPPIGGGAGAASAIVTATSAFTAAGQTQVTKGL